MKRKVLDASLVASASEAVFDVLYMGIRHWVTKDKSIRSRIRTQDFQNVPDRFTHRNAPRLSILGFLNEQPVWVQDNSLTLERKWSLRFAKIDVIDFQPQQLAAPHAGPNGKFNQWSEMLAPANQPDFEQLLFLIPAQISIASIPSRDFLPY